MTGPHQTTQEGNGGPSARAANTNEGKLMGYKPVIATAFAAAAAMTALAAPSALAATATAETTSFTYTPGGSGAAVLDVAVTASNLVPPRGTLVTFDLTALAKAALGGTPPTAPQVAQAVTALEGAPYGIPSADLPAPAAGGDQMLRLYATNVTSDSFGVSARRGGAALAAVPATVGGAKLPEVSGSASWAKVTGPKPVKPAGGYYVYGGHVITTGNTRATVGWTYGPGVTCVQVREFGYGFTVNGSPHVGFTCDNPAGRAGVGYLTGLKPGHTYALQVVPATGTYGDSQPLPGARVGWIDVVTTR